MDIKSHQSQIRNITELNPFLHGLYYWDNLFIFVYIVE